MEHDNLGVKEGVSDDQELIVGAIVTFEHEGYIIMAVVDEVQYNEGSEVPTIFVRETSRVKVN